MAGYDRLTHEGKRFYAEIEKLKRLECRVGFQSGKEVSEDNVDICDIAIFNELGTVDIPSRPFMRMSVDKNTSKINTFCKNQLSRLVAGDTAKDVLNAIGVFAKSLIQDEITDGQFVPNAPSTIRKKKSDKPLIDTGRMRQSVQYVVREKGGKRH